MSQPAQDSKPLSKWKLLDKVVSVAFMLWCLVVTIAVVTSPTSPWLLDLSDALAAHLGALTPVTKVWTLVGAVVGAISMIGVWLEKRRPMAIVALCAILQVLAILHSVAHDPVWWPALAPPAVFAAYFTARFWMREMVPRYR
ncbi:MAG: hypothetical protein HRF45_07930 [Fimbriimonadia bacterium]